MGCGASSQQHRLGENEQNYDDTLTRELPRAQPSARGNAAADRPQLGCREELSRPKCTSREPNQTPPQPALENPDGDVSLVSIAATSSCVVSAAHAIPQLDAQGVNGPAATVTTAATKRVVHSPQATPLERQCLTPASAAAADSSRLPHGKEEIHSFMHVHSKNKVGATLTHVTATVCQEHCGTEQITQPTSEELQQSCSLRHSQELWMGSSPAATGDDCVRDQQSSALPAAVVPLQTDVLLLAAQPRQHRRRNSESVSSPTFYVSCTTNNNTTSASARLSTVAGRPKLRLVVPAMPSPGGMPHAPPSATTAAVAGPTSIGRRRVTSMNSAGRLALDGSQTGDTSVSSTGTWVMLGDDDGVVPFIGHLLADTASQHTTDDVANELFFCESLADSVHA